MRAAKYWGPGSEVTTDGFDRMGSGRWVVSGTLAPKGIFPVCVSRSRRRHGRRHRRIRDFPALGDVVWMDLRVRRWRCSASGCRRSRFSDQKSSIAPPSTRHTSRPAQIASHLRHDAGGRPVARLFHRLGIGVSKETVLRQPKRIVRPGRRRTTQSRDAAPPPHTLRQSPTNVGPALFHRYRTVSWRILIPFRATRTRRRAATGEADGEHYRQADDFSARPEVTERRAVGHVRRPADRPARSQAKVL
jgi:zinc-finger of transposase IS204/IS1001/IS1096/IS1165